jgi:hypothetical protein
VECVKTLAALAALINRCNAYLYIIGVLTQVGLGAPGDLPDPQFSAREIELVLIREYNGSYTKV